MTRAGPLALLVVGARPNFVKIAPILSALDSQRCVQTLLVHTGQHYDPALSGVFLDELGVVAETVNLGVGSGSHAAQTGAVMTALESLVSERRPEVVVTVGDVNSTLAASLVAAKAGVRQVHVEAGLRSGDAAMPEEVNRVVADRLADLLFTHSEEANANLLQEGVPDERIHAVGNVMIDTLLRLQPRWQGERSRAVTGLPAEYGVVTLHRPSNVDEPTQLERIVAALGGVAREIPLIFPVHPRTRARLNGGPIAGVQFIDPLGYLAFLDLVEHARLVITDSGGIQEETTMLGVPCLTLRATTERPVTIRLGTNRLIGADPTALMPAVKAVLTQGSRPVVAPPGWDGHAAVRIADTLGKWLKEEKPLRLSG